MKDIIEDNSNEIDFENISDDRVKDYLIDLYEKHNESETSWESDS